ncbi:TetR/AcrR family transcriptional regulator [Jannaschia sp. CCS1]|uniref:TetR/AcrR family transcriptional regulator n=1 Tax=Jannaschia sp. (strain CCS1) TaxID=290400 RepID=UPI000053BC25|nr:TetR/AcrR family transcriptional regulator [Jannaschia sp. CCS1]ABD55536.1 transcriptional regulator, TetR family [Jannaschia sp. CCS1]
MARQIAYDPNTLRENLLSVFWQQGYAETSLSDLEAATGLNRRQLYNGPGDKLAMFVQAMDDFAERAGREFLGPLEQDGAGIADIVHLLSTFVALAAAKDGPTGCLVCSVSQEEVSQEQAVKRRADAYFERIKAAYENALRRSVARGECDLTERAISDHASGLYAAHVALCILGRAGRPNKELNAIAENALKDLV